MWRTLWRVKRSLGIFPNVDCKKSFDFVPNKPQISLSPALISNGTRQYFKNSCCGDDSSKSDDRRDHKAKSEKSFYHVTHDWLDAVGWSGVLLLSWYICQPYCCRRVSSNPAERYAYQRLTKCCPSQYSSVVQCISKIVLDSPAQCVLPTVNAVKSKTSSPTGANRDEALRQGCENLGIAHEKVTSSLQNFLGTECMQDGRHEEAFGHFSEASNGNNPSAIFNLGICYEMGLGAKQSFTKAAELYKKASALGHATAMYNLGVFYVHGWGGVEADGNEARHLFESAARLGQKDARRALNMGETTVYDPKMTEEETIIDEDLSFSAPAWVEPKTNDLTDLWFKVLNIKLDNIASSGSEKLSSDTDSGVNMSPISHLELSSLLDAKLV